MRVDSSPGSDGFGPAFYRTFWDVVRVDMMEFLDDFHAGTTPFITLLPKKADVLSVPSQARDPHLDHAAPGLY
jgi:hypothetical protein